MSTLALRRLSNSHPLEYLAKTRYDVPSVQLRAMMDMEYPADPIIEPHLVGMTFGQVALMQQVMRAAEGDGFALDRVLDRTIGRPVSTNVNLNKEMNYQDFLDTVAAQDTRGEIIDAESNPVRESEKIS